jgi:8-oxo-dGTP pyrophosphatase MutT (NUDIX family)
MNTAYFVHTNNMDDNWRIKSLRKDDVDHFAFNTVSTVGKAAVVSRCSPNYSYGIACCRVRDNKPEILLICKRNTYSYVSFVLGNYVYKNTYGMIKLFCGMTLEEKIDILSYNFNQIWYRAWLNQSWSNNYFACKHKFINICMQDNGKKLRNLISKSTNAKPIWEIPKGRKNNRQEPDVNCAIREFAEETGISKSKYKIFTDKQNIYSYVDDNVKYVNVYYTAIVNEPINIVVNNALREQLSEVSDCRWMNIEAIRFIDTNRRIEKFVKHIFKFVKSQ